MAQGKKTFMLYCDMIGVFEKLPDDKAGQLIKHVFDYVNDKNPQTDDLVINIAFEPIKNKLKIDLKKWEQKCEKNKENILKRWNKKDTNVYDRIPSDTKHTDKDKDKDKDKDINKEKENSFKVINFLNSQLGSSYKPTTTKTKTLISARIKEGFTLKDFNEVIVKKVKMWKGTDFEKYLRPETLFGTKFESYLQEKDNSININSGMENYKVAKGGRNA